MDNPKEAASEHDQRVGAWHSQMVGLLASRDMDGTSERQQRVRNHFSEMRESGYAIMQDLARAARPAPAPADLAALIARSKAMDCHADDWPEHPINIVADLAKLATSAPVAVQVPEEWVAWARKTVDADGAIGKSLPSVHEDADIAKSILAASAGEPAPDLSTLAPPEPISDEDKARVVESAAGQRQREGKPSLEDACPDPTEAAATSGSQTSGTSAEGSMATSSKSSAGLLAESANILGIIDAERAALGRPAESGVLSHCLAIRRFRRAIAEEERGAEDPCGAHDDCNGTGPDCTDPKPTTIGGVSLAGIEQGEQEARDGKLIDLEDLREEIAGPEPAAEPPLMCPDDLEEHRKADYHQPGEDCPVAVRRRARAAAERGEDVLRGWMRENDDFVNFDQRKHGDNDVLAELVRRELARGGGAK